MLDTLAAAYAEAGRFDAAVETAERARTLAKSAGHAEQAQKLEMRLALYRARRAYRMPAPERSTSHPVPTPAMSGANPSRPRSQ